MAKIDLRQGDCMQIMPTLKDNSVDFTLTDIPYNAVNRKDNGLRKLDKGIADILNFNIQEFCEEVYRITKIAFVFFAVKSNLAKYTSFLLITTLDHIISYMNMENLCIRP